MTFSRSEHEHWVGAYGDDMGDDENVVDVTQLLSEARVYLDKIEPLISQARNADEFLRELLDKCQIDSSTFYRLAVQLEEVEAMWANNQDMPEEPEEESDIHEPGVWTHYELNTLPNGHIYGWETTNDNDDDSYPDAGGETSWEVIYDNYEQMLKCTGGSHIGIAGHKVTVMLDGKEVAK